MSDMSTLLIVESPSKAKTISKYLGSDYVVRASVGHVRDLPKSNKKAVDIAHDFEPHYEISKGKELVVDEIVKLADKSSKIILATDPDREGEAIAWHLGQLLAERSKAGKKILDKVERVTYHEITKDAIEEALQHPRPIDQDLRHAQEARRVLDRLVGYDLSGLIWKKVRYGLSAGRVQSPALRIIMEREREIRAFISHPFWVITAETATKGAKPATLLATCSIEPTELKETERILELGRAAGKDGEWFVKAVEETKASRQPRAPFITSTLQQTASSRLGFSPSRTMGVAQKLYEAGHITYMRTDSTTLSKSALAQIFSTIEKEYGKELVSPRTFAGKSKNAQEAHEAIRPSNFGKMSAGANDEQKRLYSLIWQRTVSSQMKEAEILRTKIVLNIKSAKSETDFPDFSLNGSRLLSPGWLLADPAARGEDVEVPKVSANDPLDLREMKSEEKHTEPPPRYSEAGLVKELEKRGIGRPSTYASIIKTIVDRGYVEKQDRSLVPTDTGDVVSTFLEGNFGHYISDGFTAEIEDKLDDIALGKAKYAKTLSDFYIPFNKEVKEKETSDKITTLGDADPKFVCPKCGSPMVVKLGRNGKFLSCSRYPDCDGALMMDGVEIKKDEPIGHDPVSGLPIYVLTGKYGPYVQLGEKLPKGKKAKKPKVAKPKKIKLKKGEVAPEPTPEEKAATAAALEAAAAPVPVKPRMASIPKGKDLTAVSVEDALVYLSLPRKLGNHPGTGKTITASIGRFGPYIVHDADFRSLKGDDSPYTITLDRALEILAQEKKKRGFAKKEKKA